MRKLIFLISLFFTALAVNGQTINVTSPNGSEVWAGCTAHNITWTSSGTSGFFSVDYSTDGGTNWTSLATNLNANSYSWTIPNTSSSNCLVRVFDFNTPATVDQSNATFTITAPLILTSPNGGESWQVGGPTRNITWAASGTGTLLTLEYSIDMGVTWINITSTANAASNLYVWTVPNTPSTNCLVRVKDNVNTCMSDVSNNLFTIAPPTHNITVTAPNTATTYYVYQPYNITWTSAYLSSPNVMIEYSINNGTSWTTISSATPNTGTYTWTVPNTPSSQALVRVSESGLPAVNDVSNVNFTISSPVITVTSPNTAVTWYRGAAQTINWTSTTLSGTYVKLEYSIDNGANWITIIAATPNTSYNWTIPNTPSANCLVRVSDANAPSTFDVSNVNFTIANPVITVTSPNGGETWNGCSSQAITWTRVGTTANVLIQYSTNGGTSWTAITNNYYAGTGTNCSYTWTTVPNIPSANCLIAVVDLNTYITDQSNAPFTISPNTSIVLNTPNGGETLVAGGPAQNITWVATGTSSTLTLQYSIDNGTNWTNITTTASASLGSYAWTIPNSPSVQCLVKIFDAANTCKSDQSNAVFTISSALPYITVNSPSPGAIRYVGNSTSIGWASGYLTSPLVAIDYSIDNGANWISVTTAVSNTGSYSWTVPNTPSTQCLVRVSEYNNPAMFDVTDGPFTIIPPSITITSPNTGSEVWNGCTSQTITWVKNGTSNNSKIEYSTDGGTSWSVITASVSGTSYTWNPVLNTPSANCLVRVTDITAPTVTDVSNAPFTISQNTAIILTSPNGGQSWQTGGAAQYITWAATGTSANLTIQYSINNGVSWTTITTTAVASSSLYLWTIPNTPSTQCLIKIFDASNTCRSDVSELPFTIAPAAHVITVTAPNTATTYYVYQPYNITWTSAYLTASTVAIEYSIDNGFNWITISSSATNSGTYSWTVPNTPSSQALVRVSEFGIPSVNDVSNVNFTISPPKITVTAPNSAVTWYRGTSQPITWSNTILSGSNVKIEYSTDNGTNWMTVIASTPVANNYYSWTIPNTPSTTCLVKVSDILTPTTFDISDVNFTIASPTITVTSPNGGEIWNGCTSQTITWTRVGTTANALIQYSTNGGTSWTAIANNYYAGTGTTCSYTWTSVPNIPSTNCLIGVVDLNTYVTDQSNAPFTISPNTSIVLNTPNGGENWQVGGPTQNISWIATGTSSTLTIQYSIDNGTTWTNITTTASAALGSYAWTIPNTPSAHCLVKVFDAVNTCKSDQSAAVFTISAPTPFITVNLPNGGETRYINNSTSIGWNSGYLTSPLVAIDYSIDNGANWISVTTATTNSGSYAWTVPNTPSTQCLIKVSEYNNPALYDVSNAVFTIRDPYITVTSPNAGTEVWNGCTSQAITWIKNGITGNSKIEYSTDGGTSWSVIVASVSGASYTWNPVLNTPSANCLVRVTDVAVPTVTDVSNAPFTISQNTAIVVTSPNGGQTWQVGGPAQYITWAATGTSANLTIQYSINNGVSWTNITTTAVASSSLYLWTIPNTPSAQCLIKVFDPLNTCKSDVSNAVFTIAQPTHVITVTAPNTPVTYYVYQPYNITWTSAYLAASTVAIEYSIDNGASWVTISSSATNSGTYLWTVPNTPSNQALVRVSEFGVPSVNDVSDVNFTISPPKITVTSPNSALTWYRGVSQAITWSNTILSGSNVKIEYSTDNGASWLPVIASTPAANNYYSWMVPNTPSTTCLVKVSDILTPTTFDISDVNFTIANPVITVTSPNGGEIWNGCTSQTITWTRTGTTANASIQYSTNGGTSWTTITSNYYAGTGTNCSYTWTTVPNIPSANCLIAVVDLNTYVTDQSNAPFTISPNTSIVLNTPNGGESWQVGGPAQNITWLATGTSSTLTIQYSIDNGTTWTNITTTASAALGSYAWTIPNSPSAQCLVKIFDAANTCKMDQSGSAFTISAPTPFITVTSPNTNLTRYVGSTSSISWNSGYLSSPLVAIDYSTDNGATWISVISATSNTGSYSWLVPDTPSSTCLVRVTDYGNAATYDVSNVTFSIVPAITVTAPNGGETLNSCTLSSVNWNAGSCSGNYKIEYSVNGGTSWLTAVASYSAPATGACSYTWSVPNTPSANCLIKVSDASALAKTDQGNAIFTIAPAITITQPNVGGTYLAGSTVNINWISNGVSNYYNIDYSANNGATWNSIVFNTLITTNTYAWTVPNTTGSTYLIRVTDNVNTCKKDQSDAVFGVSNTAPPIAVTSPNGAENFASCSVQNITWNASGTSGTYNLSYSTNGGLNWTAIASNYAVAGTSCSYSWTVPNVASSNCVVKVVDAAVPANSGQSSSAFTISSSVMLTASGTAQVCSGESTLLEASGAASYAWSPATGLSDANIANPVATPAVTTTYTVTGTTGMCTNTASVTVTVHAVPNVTISPSSAGICIGSSQSLVANGASSYTWLPATNISNANVYNPTVTPPVTTTYTVTGTTAGCTNTANVVVTVNPIPVVSVSGGSSVCSGTPAALTASGATTYSWSPTTGLSNAYIANPSANPSATTTYTVTGTSSGCTSSTPVTVNVLTSPTVSVTGGGSICEGESRNLTASGATTYSWSPATGLSNPNIANPVATPSVTTTYTVTGTTGSCSATNTVTVAVTPIPVISVSGTTNICGGGSTALTASGASSYAWSPATGLNNANIANPTASPSATTAYTITGTTNGCVGTGTITINVNTVSASPSAATICAGQSTPLSASGATIYSWSPATGLSDANIANPVATPAVTTVYTVTGTTGACSNTASVVVTVNQLPNLSIAPASAAICSGSPVALSASGAVTYSWSPATGLNNVNIANPLANPSTTTTYTLTGTTAGCSSTEDITVTVNPVPVVSASPVSICAGASGQLNASGATSYVWSPATGLSDANIANPVASPSTTTTYTVTGTTGTCSSSSTVTVTVVPTPAIAFSGTATICNGTNTTITASGATSYSWSPATGLSDANIANPVASPSTTTTYTVTGTTSGCIGTGTVTVTVNPAPALIVSGSGNICAGSSANLSASGADSYVWFPATGLSDANIANPVATPSATTTYTVTGTTGTCSTTETVTVTVTPLPVVSISGIAAICNGASTSLTASGATSYVWSPATGLSDANIAGPTANPSATTAYTITGTTNGCSGTGTVTVTVNPIPIIGVAPGTTVCSGTSVNLDATGGTTYNWSPATGLSDANIANPVATPAVTTTYTVTGTSLGCSNTATVTIDVTPSPTVAISGTAAICEGGNTVLTASGATTYVWSPAMGLSDANIANPTANPTTTTTYTVTGTTNGCSNTATVTVTVTPIPVVAITGVSSICAGTSTLLTASGATSYTWSPTTGLSAANIANPTASPAGTNTYTVTGITGTCSATNTFTLAVAPAPAVSASGSATICNGSSTALNASGATSYTWSPVTGLSNPNIANPAASPAATTTYTVTGITGTCSSVSTVTVTVTPTPAISVSGTTAICAGASTVLTASGATSYTWLPATGLSAANVPNPTAHPAATTTYTVTGINGTCSGSATVTVTVNPIPAVTATGTATICAGAFTPLSASGGVTYTWSPATGLSNPNIANPTASPATTTTYTVTGTSSGCSNTAAVTVTVNPAVTANAGSPVSICLGSSTTLNASGGTTYSWSPATGLSNPNIVNPVATPTATTTYTVTVGNGTCSSTASVLVTINSASTISAGPDANISCGGSASLSASGGTTYSWSPATGLSNPNIANPVATPSVTTTYTVTATTAGCSGTDAVTVTINGLAADAGTDATLCPGDDVTLDGSVTGSGAAPLYDWVSAQSFSGDGNINCVAITIDGSGNKYITGPIVYSNVSSTVTFGGQTLSGGYDQQYMYVAKVDAAENVVWAKQYVSPNSITPTAIALDPSGNVILTGYFGNTATFGATTISANGGITAGWDVFVTKINPAGTVQWAVRSGGTSAETSNAIAVNANGIYITGKQQGTSAFGTFSVTAYGTATDYDAYVAKYNTSGVCQWVQHVGSTASDDGTGISQDAAGNIYSSGLLAGSATFGTLTTTTAATSGSETYLAKFNAAGTCLWVKTGGSPTNPEFLRSLITDASGNSYLSGGYQGTAQFGAQSITTAGLRDAFVVKYDAAGTELWARTFGGASNDDSWDICFTPTGNIMVDALGYSSISSPVSITFGSTTIGPFGTSGQPYLVEYTPAGAEVAALMTTSPSPAGELIHDLEFDNNGNLYTCGYYGNLGSPVSQTVAFGSTTFSTVAGKQNSFLAKAMPTTPVVTYAWSPATGLSNANIANPIAAPAVTTTYTLTVSNGGTCPAADNVTVTVLPNPSRTVTQAACGSYTLNSQVYTTSGTYTQTKVNATGCDSLITLNLTISQPTAATLVRTGCMSYTLNAQTYTASGTYTQHLTNTAGCDSTITLNLTINQPQTSTVTQTACGSYTYNGQTYTASGTYTQVNTLPDGCTNTVTLNLTIKQPTAAVLTQTACGSYTLNGQTYTSSGTYMQTGLNVAGCDSTITLNLIIKQPTASTLTQAACGSYTLNTQTYTTSGVYIQHLTNAVGCDSTITLNLTIDQPQTSTVTQTACGSYTLNGQTYTSSGTYTQTNTTPGGCTSNVTLHLTVHQPGASTLTQTACGSYTLNSQAYTASGTYTQLVQTAFGCDSTITLNLTIKQPTASTLTQATCGTSYTLNTQTYTTSGVYTQHLTNAAGCDSTITLNLTISQPQTSTVTQTACGSYTLNGQTYTTSGTYTQVNALPGGCTSTVTLHLTISQPGASTLTQIACGTYTLNSQVYTASGTYTQLTQTANGCDSTITLNLTIKQPSASTLTEVTCAGSYTLNAQTYTASGTYTQVLTNAAGCDSTITLNLTLNTVDVSTALSGTTITANQSGPGAVYQWINCAGNTPLPGATSQSYTAAANGSYAVIITKNGCTDTSACVTVSSVGLDDLAAIGHVSVFPNPTGGNVTVSLTGFTGPVSLKLYTVNGQLVYEEMQVAEENHTLDLSELANGMYYIEAQQGTAPMIRERIVKN